MSVILTRRAVLGSAAGAALGVREAIAGDATQVKLRLLETSDLHMFVMDWDYYHAKPDPSVGFAKVATLIRAARAEAQNSLLFDNGDFLQGNPLADFVAAGPAPSAAAPHPIVAIMASLGYDAVGLGNHEFNYGLPFLEASLAGAPFPFVCANAVRAGGAMFLPPHAILERQVTDTNGAKHILKIGVIGFVPPQIMDWDKSKLDGVLETSDIVLTARRMVPALRARCDVLVALCHSGIKTGEWTEGQENAAFHLASVPGFDVIFTGHSHRLFPGKDYAGLDGVDAVAGRLQGVPAVMPGFWGSHLGVADLTLRREGGEAARWSVADVKVETRAIAKREQRDVIELTTRDGAIARLIAPAHQATLAWVEQPAGVLEAPVHSYFVWAGFDPATALVNLAQAWYARPLLARGPHAGLALLSSAAPYRAGYTPDGYIDIAAGPASLREVADLYYYSSNTVVVLKVTGAQLLEWLEFSARVFRTIDPAASAAGSQALPGQAPAAAESAAGSQALPGQAPAAAESAAGSQALPGQAPAAAESAAGSQALPGQAPAAAESAAGSQALPGQAPAAAESAAGSQALPGQAPAAAASAAGSQALVEKTVPSYAFDIVSGVTYEIDVTKPPRYDGKGKQLAETRRIVNLRFEGQPIDPARAFAVVTNNYRADGRAQVPGLAGAEVILRAPDTNRDALMGYFKAGPSIAPPRAFPWSFAKTGQAVAVHFDTGKPAASRIADVAGLTLAGDGEPGYIRVALTIA